MESYTSGRFHEYTPVENEATSPKAGGGEGGAQPGTDMCDRVIESARLEEIERSQYHKKHSRVPRIEDLVRLRKGLEAGRLVIEHASTNLSVGYLPTRFNYLVQCLASGRKYNGKVTASTDSPSARIVIELSPS